jgi:DeoR/GlpR family transcriptional regulator of sugar metabolism
MTQHQKIVEYIKKNGSITSFDAYTKCGITQLATRIKELKEQGYAIRSEWVVKPNTHYKKYWIEVSDDVEM